MTEPREREVRTRCPECGREQPYDEEWDTTPEGWGEWLCWGDPADCHNAKALAAPSEDSTASWKCSACGAYLPASDDTCSGEDAETGESTHATVRRHSAPSEQGAREPVTMRDDPETRRASGRVLARHSKPVHCTGCQCGAEGAPQEDDDPEEARCTCNWQSPLDGRISGVFPFVTDPHCVVPHVAPPSIHDEGEPPAEGAHAGERERRLEDIVQRMVNAYEVRKSLGALLPLVNEARALFAPTVPGEREEQGG